MDALADARPSGAGRADDHDGLRRAAWSVHLVVARLRVVPGVGHHEPPRDGTVERLADRGPRDDDQPLVAEALLDRHDLILQQNRRIVHAVPFIGHSGQAAARLESSRAERSAHARRAGRARPTTGCGRRDRVERAGHDRHLRAGRAGSLPDVPRPAGLPGLERAGVPDPVHRQRDRDESTPRSWQAVHLENRWIRLMVLPELGGRIHIGYDKIAGYDFFYRNNVIKPALVGLAGPWISGGVEFNWPQHHRPGDLPARSTSTIEEGDDGSVTVWCSDHDPFTRMKGMHGIRLRPDRAVGRARRAPAQPHERGADLPLVGERRGARARRLPVVLPDRRAATSPTTPGGRSPRSRPPTGRTTASTTRRAPPTGGDRLDFYRNIPVPTSYMVTDTQDDFFGGYDHRARRRVRARRRPAHRAGQEAVDLGRRRRSATPGIGCSPTTTARTSSSWPASTPTTSPTSPGSSRARRRRSRRPGSRSRGSVPCTRRTSRPPSASTSRTAMVQLGLCVPAERPGSRIVITARGRTLVDEVVDLAPGAPYTSRVPARGIAAQDVEVSVVQDGADLIRWRPRPASRGAEPVGGVGAGAARSDRQRRRALPDRRAPGAVPAPDPLAAAVLAGGAAPRPRTTRAATSRSPTTRYRRADYAVAETHVRRALARLTARNAQPARRRGVVPARPRSSRARAETTRRTTRSRRPPGTANRLAAASVELARIEARRGRMARRRSNGPTPRSVRNPMTPGRGRSECAPCDSWAAATRPRPSSTPGSAVDPLDQVALTLAGRQAGRDPRTMVDVALDLGRGRRARRGARRAGPMRGAAGRRRRGMSGPWCTTTVPPLLDRLGRGG